MTNTNLDEMNLKGLRQLASEHQIPGRSRLAKDDLIQALTQVLAKHRADQIEAKTEAKTEAKADTAPEPKRSAKRNTRSKRPSAATTPNTAGPEVLDPASLAAFTSTPEAPESNASDDATDHPDAPGDEVPDDQPKKRRRRRSRRRKKKTGDEATDEATDEAADENEAPATASNASPAAETTDRPAPPERQQTAADRPANTGDQTRPSRKAEPASKAEPSRRKPDTDRRAADDEAESTRRPPHIEGPQRQLGPMHERLVKLAEGILELCDPETPRWAQARLSELLAEAGLAPIPCQGEPHPDYHTVCGSLASDAVPAGHIVEVSQPGFCLRGDRGAKLFPLRKAQVRIAGQGSQPDQPAREQTPVAPAPPAETTPRSAPSEAPTAPEAAQEQADRAEADDQRAAADHAPADDHSLPTDQAEADERSTTVDQRPSAAVPEDREPPLEPAPMPKAPAGSRRHRSRAVLPELAEPLPLKMQDPSELADRPKAESWRALGLNDQLLADLYDMNYVSPSPIQEKGIPVALSGADMVGQAQTGTGKTAAFVLPILHRLYELEQEGTAALVLCPTRELARQVHAHFIQLAGKSSARAALIYGGVSLNDQIRALDLRPHVVIGTPGRVIDHIRRGNLICDRLSFLVLDEADQMLDIGFLPDIEYVLKHSNPTRQILLFSATMPDEIRRVSEQYQKDPQTVHVLPERVTADKVDQAYIAVDQNKKTALLQHYIETENPSQLVVFCKTRAQTDRVATVLKRKQMKAAAINGDLPQQKRERTLQAFRDGELNCLIATNVAARGLDIPSVSHVINYDIPEYAEDYVHRIGRTARMGKEGFARTFITPEDGQFLLEIEKLIGMELPEEEVEGITASTATEIKRSIADIQVRGPRLLKPLTGGIRLGRRRRR